MKLTIKSAIASALILQCAGSFAAAQQDAAAAATFSGVAVETIADSVSVHAGKALSDENRTGGNLWLDVTGASAKLGKAKTVDGDMHVVVLGADVKTEAGVFGVAYSFGRASGDVLNGASSFESENFGVQLFGATSFGPVDLTANAGWLRQRGNTASGHIKGDVLSAGIELSTTVKAGPVSFTPFAGTSVVNYNPENFGSASPDAFTYMRTPVGLRVASEFETCGMKVRPNVWGSAVFFSGDDSVNVHSGNSVLAERVHSDEKYEAGAGLEVTGDKASLAVDYRVVLGSENERVHEVMLRGKYGF